MLQITGPKFESYWGHFSFSEINSIYFPNPSSSHTLGVYGILKSDVVSFFITNKSGLAPLALFQNPFFITVYGMLGSDAACFLNHLGI